MPWYARLPAVALFIFASAHLPAQISFSQIDARAQALDIRGDTLERLTEQLVAPYATEREQARAIFSWITAHVAYDCRRRARAVQEADDVVAPLYFTHIQLKSILATRRTHCDGYALLFKTMCNLAGLRATIVEGYAETGFGNGFDPQNPTVNHAWNAVCVDGEWYPVDVTFASGSCNGPIFNRGRSDEYFLMTPEVEKRRHRALFLAGEVQQSRPGF